MDINAHVATLSAFVGQQPYMHRISRLRLEAMAAGLVGAGISPEEILLAACSVDLTKMFNQPASLWVVTENLFIASNGTATKVDVDGMLVVPTSTFATTLPSGNRVISCEPGGSVVVLEDVGSPEAARLIADQMTRIHEQCRESDPALPLACFPLNQVYSVAGIRGLRSGDSISLTFYRDRVNVIDANGSVAIEIPFSAIRGLQALDSGQSIPAGNRGYLPVTNLLLSAEGVEIVGVSIDFLPHDLEAALIPAYAALNAAPAQTGATGSGISAELERLSDLHARGLLDDDEFKAAKAKLLQ